MVRRHLITLRAVWAIGAAGFVLATASIGAAATYSGTLAQAGVVWISDESKPAPVPEAQMRNVNKAFVPDLIVITAGSSVRFPNDDAFFHSIFSQGAPDPFDIGFYDNGPGKTVAFPNAGVATVRCHIHGTMHGTIVIVDGPWVKTDAANQKYTLDNVRPGLHVLHEWTLDGGERKLSVRV